MNKKGFTLVELIIAMAILSLMVVILVGILNPVALFKKARDTQRKKDLRRISISFEDYFNDKGCYPDEATVGQLMSKINCGSSIVFRPWLKPWVCDPNGSPYEILIGYDLSCPKWFKVLAVLENKSDKDIISNFDVGLGTTEVNFGVSSGNISVDELTGEKDPHCLNGSGCYYYDKDGFCNSIGGGCEGSNCYREECSSRCKVSCCGVGCD